MSASAKNTILSIVYTKSTLVFDKLYRVNNIVSYRLTFSCKKHFEQFTGIEHACQKVTDVQFTPNQSNR